VLDVYEATKDDPAPGFVDGMTALLDRAKHKGRFTTANTPTFIELEERRARHVPGPDAYHRKDGMASHWENTPTTFNANTAAHRGAEGGDYDGGDGGGGGGGGDGGVHQRSGPGVKFGTSSGKSDVDWLVYDASTKPGPGQYQVGGKPDADAVGGRFGNSEVRNFIEEETLIKSFIPGPGAHNVQPIKSTEGGLISKSNARGYAEELVYEHRGEPGPGHYKPVTGMAEANSSVGFRFNKNISKTHLEMLQLEAGRTPGPGAYSSTAPRAPGMLGSDTVGGRIGGSSGGKGFEDSRLRYPGPGAYELTADQQMGVGFKTGGGISKASGMGRLDEVEKVRDTCS
jgi:hypothetical protein